MARLLIDALGGCSGDMFLAALIDLGASARSLAAGLRGLDLPEPFRLRVEKSVARGFSGTRVEIRLKHGGRWTRPENLPSAHVHGHGHRHDHEHGGRHAHTPGPARHRHPHAHRAWSDIDRLLRRARLPTRARERARVVFKLLAEAEGRVHGIPAARVAFHEVGATDSILDIVGVCLGLEELGADELLCSAIGVATGFVDCAHGRLPLPAPATHLLLEGRPVIQTGESTELCTPTGAALLVALARFTPPTGAYAVERTGIGLSHRIPEKAPPFLRVSEIRAWETAPAGLIRERLCWICADLDDMQPEYLRLAEEHLRAAGALDVSFAPLHMKKGRLGVEVRALAAPERADAVAAALLEHTTTFGLRRTEVLRDSLPRRMEAVRTRFGNARVKVGTLPSGATKHHVEYEDVARISREKGVAWSKVLAEVERRRLE